MRGAPNLILAAQEFLDALCRQLQLSARLESNILERTMKITINVDCTPEEARTFMGLPDVAPIQDAMMDQMKTQMQNAASAMDPETMFKTLFPQHSEGLAGMQKAFWSQFAGAKDDK